jgi:signal peptidase I
LTVPTNPQIEYAMPSTPRLKPRRIGFLVVCAAILFPGLGHLIAHEFRRAVFWFGLIAAIGALMLVATLTPLLIPLLLVLMPLTLIVQVVSWVDAFRYGHRFRAPLLGHPIVKYPLGLLLLASLSLWHFTRVYEKTYLLEAFLTSSDSMIPTLSPGDLFLVQKFPTPKRWDIVIIISPQDSQKYAKRLIGFPGEKIEIIGGVLHVNGQPQHPPISILPYASVDAFGRKIRDSDGPTGCEGDPITLGADEYYVLGDNSPISFDARYWNRALPGHQRGTLPRSSIIGVATWIYWPPSRWRRLN